MCIRDRLLIFVISIILSCSPGYSQKYLKEFISDLKNTDEYSQWKIPTKVFKKEIKLGFKKSEIESNLNKVNSGINAVYEHNTEITDMEICLLYTSRCV